MPANGQPYDVYARLEDPVGVLAVALAQWEERDDTRPQPAVRRAANDAVDAIDAMLRDLHLIRARLISEVRASDDATAIRADALLAGSADAMTSSSRQASPEPAGPRDGKARGAEDTPGQRERES